MLFKGRTRDLYWHQTAV